MKLQRDGWPLHRLMIEDSLSKKSPLSRIIEIGLELWIRGQCKAIKKIDLKLFGSTFQLLSGKVSNVRLIANEINFKGLILHYLDIQSGDIQLKIPSNNKNKKFGPEKAFNIQGIISLTSEGINLITSTAQWSWIGEWLAKELLEADKLEHITINGSKFELECSTLKKKNLIITKESFELEATSGTICFKNPNKSKVALLPMDPSIKIDKVSLKEGEMFLTGLAKVSP